MDEDGAQASGLTLSEAFARMMALAHCDYSFVRSNGDVCLILTPADAPDSFPVSVGIFGKVELPREFTAEIRRGNHGVEFARENIWLKFCTQD